MDNSSEDTNKPAGTPFPSATDELFQSSSAKSLGLGSSGSGLVTARGTAEGLVLRIDARVDETSMMIAVREFVESRKKFLFGNEVAIEWVGGKPSDELEFRLRGLLLEDFNMKVRHMGLRASIDITESNPDVGISNFINPVKNDATTAPANERILPFEQKRPTASSTGRNSRMTDDESVSLFGGVESFGSPAEITGNWDEANGRVLFTTLRSGQKIESEHSVIIFGDVNSGAEVISGGDVVVFGSLRGVAHAGAYDETGGGRIIMALSLQPTQLRIGSIISRGSSEGTKGLTPEFARVDGNGISVEPYSTKGILGFRKGDI